MVERRRYLNQRLQKTLLRLFECHPDSFPVLVGEEEFSSPIAGQAVSKRATMPFEGHAPSIGDPFA